MKYLFALLSLAVGRFYFVPTTYYVTPAGSGTGTGLDSNNTLSYAALYPKALAYGDIVKFKAGNVYYGQHYPKDGVTYDRYSAGANPVISGYTTLTGWTLSSGNVWYVNLPGSIRGVSVDGTLRGYGRYPNTGYLTYTSHSGNSSITGTTVGSLPNSFVGGEVVIKKWRYLLDRHMITGRAGNTLSFTSTNFYGNSSNDEPTDGNGYFIQNHPAALDLPGEWSSDGSKLFMSFPDGNPSAHVVKAATIDVLVALNSTVGATFQNIDFEGANTVLNNNFTYGVSIFNCNIRQCGMGVYGDGCGNLRVGAGTTITDAWSNGILVEANGHNTIVDNVTLNRTAIIPGMGQSGDGRYNGIGVAGINTTITNCIVRNTGFNGIAFDGDTVLVEHNLIDTFCTLKDDGGGMYTFAAFPNASIGYTGIKSDRKIRNNIILNAIGAPDGAQGNGDPAGEAAAIYLDGFSNHTEVSGNSGAHGPWAGIFINGNSDNQILNNTMFDFRQQLLVSEHAVSGNGSVRNLTVTGNKLIARTTGQRSLWVTFGNGIADNPVNLGSWNNNVYARPLDDSLTITLFRPNQGFYQDMTLNTWKVHTYRMPARPNPQLRQRT